MGLQTRNRITAANAQPKLSEDDKIREVIRSEFRDLLHQWVIRAGYRHGCPTLRPLGRAGIIPYVFFHWRPGLARQQRDASTPYCLIRRSRSAFAVRCGWYGRRPWNPHSTAQLLTQLALPDTNREPMNSAPTWYLTNPCSFLSSPNSARSA
jgi:hypothetical protein